MNVKDVRSGYLVKFASGYKVIDTVELLGDHEWIDPYLAKIWFEDGTILQIHIDEVLEVKRPDVTITLTYDEASLILHEAGSVYTDDELAIFIRKKLRKAMSKDDR